MTDVFFRLKFPPCIFFIILVTSTSGEENTSVVFSWDRLKPKTCITDENFTLPTGMQVTLMLTINAVYDISEEKMEFGMQIQLVETWGDPFMVLPDEYEDLEENKIVPSSILKCMWKPDTIFLNSKSDKLYSETLPNVYTKLTLPLGIMYRSSRYRLTVACGMDFHLFPMDTQNCSMQMTMLSSRKGEVSLSWCFEIDELNIRPIRLNFNIKPLNFKIVFLAPTQTEIEYTKNEIAEILSANLLFVRSLTASLVNVYIPSTLIVCLSMVSFWLDVSAVPGRVTLGVTAILTLSTQIVSARNALPTLDYMTAMDIWLLGCMFMVFLSLIEFTCAQAWTRTVAYNLETVDVDKKVSRVSNVKGHAWAISYGNISHYPKKRVQMNKRYSFDPRNFVKNLKEKKDKSKSKKRDNILDRFSRIFFPILMVAFTSLYFWHYTNEKKLIESRIGEIIQR